MRTITLDTDLFNEDMVSDESLETIRRLKGKTFDLDTMTPSEKAEFDWAQDLINFCRDREKSAVWTPFMLGFPRPSGKCFVNVADKERCEKPNQKGFRDRLPEGGGRPPFPGPDVLAGAHQGPDGHSRKGVSRHRPDAGPDQRRIHGPDGSGRGPRPSPER